MVSYVKSGKIIIARIHATRRGLACTFSIGWLRDGKAREIKYGILHEPQSSPALTKHGKNINFNLKNMHEYVLFLACVEAASLFINVVSS
jgi:hypothetical protein